MATLSNIYSNTSFALGLHTEALARLQEQAATGSRINRASDDPSTAYRILGLNSQEKSLQNYIYTLQKVGDLLTSSSTAIGDSDTGIQHVLRTITDNLTTISGSTGAGGIAEQIDVGLGAIVSFANTSYSGQYLFGGSDTASAPYLVQRTGGKITSVTYQGSLDNRDVEVAPGVESSAFHVGDNLFRSDNRSTPTFPDSGTGAAAGTGTSNACGDVWLTVTDDTDPDKYRLSINGGTDYVTVEKGKRSEEQTLTFSSVPGSGSFSLVFGEQMTGAIQWDEGAAEVQTALENLSNLDEGDVTVTGDYAAGFTITFADTLGNVPELVVGNNSLGVTITPSTTTEGIGDANLAVTDSTGRVLYVNTTGITSTGVDWVRVPGTYDIFSALITIRDRLETEGGLTNTQLQELRSNALQSLQELSSLLVGDSVSMGSRIGFLNDLKGSLDNIEYNTKNEAARLEEADIAEIAINLSRREVLYQMSLSVAARLMSMSLLDFVS